MSENEFGLDDRYFGEKLGLVVRDIKQYTPEELYYELSKIIKTINCPSIMVPDVQNEQLQSQLQAKEQELVDVKDRYLKCSHELLEANERIEVLEEALTYIANKSFPINKQGLSKVKFPDQIAREALEDK